MSLTTATPPAAAHAVLSAPATLTLQRLLPGPIERVWAYLTESDLRRQWLAAGEMRLQPGAEFELVWRNDELSASAAERPEGFAAESRATCRITEVDAPHRLSFDWPNVGAVTFELAPAGEGEVQLTITHRGLPDHALTLKVAAGWHAHTDVLAARLAGVPGASLWPNWGRLHEEYKQRLAK